MGKITQILLAEEARLKEILKSTEKRLENAPEGSLRLSSNKSGRMYYHHTDKKEYISKKNTDLIRKLAQKDYDEKVYEQARKELGQLEEWKAKEYKGLGFREDMPLILTEKGERVRSKSEKIIADYFYHNGIEYKYECPVYLKGKGFAYPDFTLLSEIIREEIYYEHFGMMDDPAYARKAVKKILDYEESGIYLGERLIATFETNQTVLGTKQLEQLVKKYVRINATNLGKK